MARDQATETTPFRILSLSGGGCLGYYTACVLAALEARAGEPLTRRFDLLAGTSIGGIMALTLAAGVSAERARENFQTHSTEVFSGRTKANGWMQGVNDMLRALFSPKYSAARLRANLAPLLGDQTLGELDVPVMITALDVADGSARLFSSLNEADRNLKAIDVAMATSAVPTFYPVARVGSGLYVDGGLFANAPDLLVASECEHVLGIDQDRMDMVSVGTTSTHFTLPGFNRRAMGAMEWLMQERMVRLTISAQQSATGTMMRRMLGARYLRIDAVESPFEQDVLGLDVATQDAQDILAHLAVESLQTVESNELLRSILTGEQSLG